MEDELSLSIRLSADEVEHANVSIRILVKRRTNVAEVYLNDKPKQNKEELYVCLKE